MQFGPVTLPPAVIRGAGLIGVIAFTTYMWLFTINALPNQRQSFIYAGPNDPLSRDSLPRNSVRIVQQSAPGQFRFLGTLKPLGQDAYDVQLADNIPRPQTLLIVPMGYEAIWLLAREEDRAAIFESMKSFLTDLQSLLQAVSANGRKEDQNIQTILVAALAQAIASPTGAAAWEQASQAVVASLRSQDGLSDVSRNAIKEALIALLQDNFFNGYPFFSNDLDTKGFDKELARAATDPRVRRGVADALSELAKSDRFRQSMGVLIAEYLDAVGRDPRLPQQIALMSTDPQTSARLRAIEQRLAQLTEQVTMRLIGLTGRREANQLSAAIFQAIVKRTPIRLALALDRKDAERMRARQPRWALLTPRSKS
ncbi:MAG: hypothetical protein EBY21_00615 [Alphaproteobacteria bacterium]|nr:hypothetical protein [Alphaproteobacteria bacterium]